VAAGGILEGDAEDGAGTVDAHAGSHLQAGREDSLLRVSRRDSLFGSAVCKSAEMLATCRVSWVGDWGRREGPG
jgi:hypothetical protein